MKLLHYKSKFLQTIILMKSIFILKLLDGNLSVLYIHFNSLYILYLYNLHRYLLSTLDHRSSILLILNIISIILSMLSEYFFPLFTFHNLTSTCMNLSMNFFYCLQLQLQSSVKVTVEIVIGHIFPHC